MNGKNSFPLSQIEWVQKNWREPLTLIVAGSLAFVFGYKGVIFIFSESKIPFFRDYLWQIAVSIGFLLFLIVSFFWVFSRRYPRIKKNKIGIVIAIRSNCPEAKKVRDDVIDKFNTTIGDLPIRDRIDLLPLDDFWAKKVINRDSALVASNKCRAHFIVWGKSLSYRFDSQTNQYAFDLSFLVRHRPLKPQVRLIVLRGFQEALVGKTWRFLEKDIINGIKVTADNIREVALYIVGIASFLSFDFETSTNFHLSLHNLLRQDLTKRRALRPIEERLPSFLSDAFNMLGLISYQRDRNTEQALSLTDKALRFSPHHYSGLVNKACYLVEFNRIGEAKEIVKILRKINSKHPLPNSAWRYSDAFLLFLDEEFKKGVKAYKRVFDGYITDFTLESVINFTENFVARHPDKIQFLYALGAIYFYKKENLQKALDNFEKFLKQAGEDKKFEPLVIRARGYTQQICKGKEMNIKRK